MSGELGRPGEGDRAAALERVRALLHRLDTTDEEIEAALENDTIDLLVADRLLVPAHRRYTEEEVAERSGVPVELSRRLWRALGFQDAGDDRVFTDMDIEALHLFSAMVAMEMTDPEEAVHMARVIGMSMARIAEAQVAPGSTPTVLSSGDSVLDADLFAANVEASLPAMARMLEFVWRRHLQAANRRMMLLRHRAEDPGANPELVVGFADMVGYTVLAQHLDEHELAEIVTRFETIAHDTVTGLGGQVVKMIGDEAMFVAADVADAARIGLSLAEAYGDDEVLSDVRVSLAYGPVLIQDGDYYGATVNFASRMVNIARPGTVLVTAEVQSVLAEEHAGEFVTKVLRPRYLKDIGRVQVFRLLRADREQGDDTGRSLRRDRIGDVLAELEELRARGEELLGRARDGRSRIHQADGGDSVRAKLERAVDRGQRGAPQVDEPPATLADLDLD